MPAIPLEDNVVYLAPTAPPFFKPCPSTYFYYQLEHTFILDRTVFAQALTTMPHLFSSGFFGMVYEHFLGCFIPKDPSSRFLELF
jgi:hypothetical protein